jgi:hypothetical protein
MGDAVRPAAQSAPSLKLWSVGDLREAGRSSVENGLIRLL